MTNEEFVRRWRQIDSFAIRSSYPLSVNYERKLVGAGCYAWIDSDIIPTHRRGENEIVVELVNLVFSVSTSEAFYEIRRLGLRPADLQELLAFGEKYPKVRSESPIVSLGSVWKDQRKENFRVPCLYDRWLILEDWNRDWSPVFCFAAVRQ